MKIAKKPLNTAKELDHISVIKSGEHWDKSIEFHVKVEGLATFIFKRKRDAMAFIADLTNQERQSSN
jgi:hypothetical protein